MNIALIKVNYRVLYPLQTKGVGGGAFNHSVQLRRLHVIKLIFQSCV